MKNYKKIIYIYLIIVSAITVSKKKIKFEITK